MPVFVHPILPWGEGMTLACKQKEAKKVTTCFLEGDRGCRKRLSQGLSESRAPPVDSVMMNAASDDAKDWATVGGSGGCGASGKWPSWPVPLLSSVVKMFKTTASSQVVLEESNKML